MRAASDEGLAASPRPQDVDGHAHSQERGAIRMRRVLPSSGWSLAGTVVISVYSFLLVSYLLRTLGPEAFAPWAAAVALLGYLSLLDAGLSATTTRDAAHAAAGHADAINRVVAANALFGGLALAATVLGVLGALVIPAFLGLDGSASQEATVIASLLTLDFAIVLATAGWHGILRGNQRYDVIFLGNLSHAVVAGIVIVVLVGSVGMVGAAFGQLAGRVASRWVIAILIRRRISWVRLVPGIPRRTQVRALWAFSLPVFALQLATQIGVGTDVIIVGLSAGAASVGLYAAGSQLVRNVAYLILPILSVLLPTLSRATFEDALSTVRQIPTLVMMAAIIGASTFGGLAAEASPVMQLWSGAEPPLSIGVLSAYAFAFVLITPVQVLVLSLIATGRHALIGAVVLVDSLVNVGLSIILAQAIGPIGVAISTLILVTIDDGFIIPKLAARRLGIPVRTIYLAMYGGVAIGLAIVALGQLLPVAGTAGLAVRFIVGGLATLAAVAAVWRRAVLTMRAEASMA